MDSNASGLQKMRTGARKFFLHRIHLPLPLFIFKIALILALITFSALAVINNIVLTKKMQWSPSPIILVPGLISSKLYVEGFGVEYPAELAEECSADVNIPLRKSWISEHLQKKPNCELFLLSLRHQGDKFLDQPNVQVTSNLKGVPFGASLWPVQCTFTDENLQNCDISTFLGLDDSYFRPLAEFLISRLKYQQGKTLFAAQYDWRHHQQSDVMNKYYEDLQFLVEHAFNMTNKKAILLAHSMGNIVINRFLREKVTPEWQKKHLEATINVAAPYGGSSKSIMSLISGEPMLDGSISQLQMAKFVRQMGYTANLLPFKNAFGNTNLLKIGEKEYSAEQMADFMRTVGIGHLTKFYAENEPIPQKHTPMHCIYSIGQNNTHYKYEYASLGDKEPRIEWGDGDETVNAESLRICQDWKRQGHSVKVKEFRNMKHTAMLMQKEFLAYIAELLTSL